MYNNEIYCMYNNAIYVIDLFKSRPEHAVESSQ